MNVENNEIRQKNNSAKRPPLCLSTLLLAASLTMVSIVGYAHPAGTHESTYAQIDLEHLHKIANSIMDSAEAQQKSAIENMIKTSRPELEALNERALAAKNKKLNLLLQDSMDINAVEKASADEIKAADELSVRIDAALVDLAKLMTSEQRARLRDHVNGH